MGYKSRSKKKIKSQKITCESCSVYTDLFVAILKSITPTKHYLICLDCYQRDIWQTKIATKEATMKGGSSNGLRRKASKQNVNRCLDHWEEILNIKGQRLVAEVKYRDKSNFPNPFNVLDKRDIALYKRKVGKPNTLVIMSGEQFVKLIGE